MREFSSFDFETTKIPIALPTIQKKKQHTHVISFDLTLKFTKTNSITRRQRRPTMQSILFTGASVVCHRNYIVNPCQSLNKLDNGPFYFVCQNTLSHCAYLPAHSSQKK